MSDVQPYWARPSSETPYYTWNGVQYPRVTSILGMASGSGLMPWYAKQAALKAASHLYSAGIEMHDKTDDSFMSFIGDLTPRAISLEEAYQEIFNWQKVMREAERYRDHKGRIGSIVHHYLYEFALGRRVAQNEMIDYLQSIAVDLNLFEVQPTKAMLATLATSAYAYVLSAQDWLDKALPEIDEIGIEACVIHFYTFDKNGESNDDGYAGTTDTKFTLKKSVFEKHFDWPATWGEKRTLRTDFKCSNSLPKWVQAQCEAYDSGDIIGIMKTGDEFPMETADGCACLHIGPHASAARVQDEYGFLTTKSKQIGAKLWSWPKHSKTQEAFLGLCKWWHWGSDLPKPEQAKVRRPAEPKLKKTDIRPVSF